MRSEVLRLDRVTQKDDGTVLLNNLSLHIFQNEIMGLICINSYGMDALLELICQNIPLHYGQVYFREQLVNSYKRSSLLPNRVALIDKRSSLVEDLTVADNLFILRKSFKKYLINTKVLDAQYAMFVKDLDISFKSDALVSSLTPFEKCVLELLKAIVAGVRLVVLRDIGSFVSVADLERFHSFLRLYATQGVSFLYICNNHEEAFHICDRIALMENGEIHKTLNKEEFKAETILNFASFDTPPSVETPAPVPPAGRDTARIVLEFQHVASNTVDDLNFTIREGESVVLHDLNNKISDDFIGLLTGRYSPDSGQILLDGRPWKRDRASRNKLCIIEENPVQSMVFPEMTFLDNLCFLLSQRTSGMWVNTRLRSSVLQEYEPYIGKDIYAADLTHLSLSSLYNLVYYQVHLYHPKAVICVKPFSDADIYMQYNIIRLMGELLSRRIALVILTGNVTNTLAVADRLLIIEQGQVKKEYARQDFSSLGGDMFL